MSNKFGVSEFDIINWALTVWAEARGESPEGQRGVAWVIRTRYQNPGWWSHAGAGITPNTISAVCLSPRQFSCWNKDDPNRAKLLDLATRRRADFQDIKQLCIEVLAQSPEEDPTNGADHYCTKAILPKVRWARGKTPVATIDSHVFFKLGLDGR
jgi:spore germination cell wall hydrolase CwlJ-like protein